MAPSRSEKPFAMRFAVRPAMSETPRQAIAKEGGRYDDLQQKWVFPGGRSVRETKLGETGTNIKDYTADDKSGKDE